MRTRIPSLVKWSGSKRSQAHFLCDLLPQHNRYFEPFLGGGALLFLADGSPSFASDVYHPLVELWLLAKNNPDLLISDYNVRWHTLKEELMFLRSKEGKIYLSANKGTVPEIYYSTRDDFNDTRDPLALNFILRTCVNGIVRFNSSGDFNNSFHLSRDGMAPERFKDVVLKWHRRLANVTISCIDYRETLEMVETGDFVYLDPPYLGCINRYCQPVIAAEFFGYLEMLNSKGVLWVSSFDGYSDDKDYKSNSFPESIYEDHIYIRNGRSFTSGVLNSKEGSVYESIYANFSISG